MNAPSSASNQLVDLQGSTVGPGSTRRAPEAIEAVFLSKRIGPLQHKIYHVFLGWSQSILDERMAAGEPFEPVTQFTLPLSDVMALCDYGSERSSHNLDHFEKSATSLMGFQVVYGGFQQLRQGLLPHEQEEEQPTEKRKRGGRRSRKEKTYLQLVSMVHFDWERDELVVEFPSDLVRMLLLPTNASVIDWLSLDQFSSTAAIQLYGFVLQYERDGRTPEKHWTDYSRLLSAGPDAHKTFREFNKLLQRTVKHVMEVDQRFDIAPRFIKKGRFVERMWFDVRRRAQQALPLAPVPDDLVQKLCNFGITRSQAEKLCRDYPRHHIEANYEYCVQQKRAGGIKRTTAGFLRAAIVTNYAKAPARAATAEAPPSSNSARNVPTSAESNAPLQAANSQRELLRKLPLAVRRSMLEESLRSLAPASRAVLPRDLDPAQANEQQLVDPRVEGILLAWWERRSAATEDRPSALAQT